MLNCLGATLRYSALIPDKTKQTHMSSNVQSYSQSGFLYGRLIASPQESTGKSGWFPLSCTAGVNTALLQEVGETGHETGASLTSAFICMPAAYTYMWLEEALTRMLLHVAIVFKHPPPHTHAFLLYAPWPFQLRYIFST